MLFREFVSKKNASLKGSCMKIGLKTIDLWNIPQKHRFLLLDSPFSLAQEVVTYVYILVISGRTEALTD